MCRNNRTSQSGDGVVVAFDASIPYGHVVLCINTQWIVASLQQSLDCNGTAPNSRTVQWGSTLESVNGLKDCKLGAYAQYNKD